MWHYTTLGTLINLVCTSLCAYPLSRPDLLGKKQVIGMIVFTMFFSGGMIPAYLVMNQTKLIDTIWTMALPGAISTYTLFYDNRVKRHLKPISLSSTEDRVAQVEIHSTINAMVAITDAVTETMLLYPPANTGNWRTARRTECIHTGGKCLEKGKRIHSLCRR